MNAMREHWRDHPVFAGLSVKDLDFLSGLVTTEMFAARELVFHAGDAAEKFYLITEGAVAVEIFVPERGPVTIQTVNEGDVLGWSWLVDPYLWNFDAQATMPTATTAFDAAALRERFDEDKKLGYTMIKRFFPIVMQRMQATRLQVLDVYDVHH